MKGEGSEGRRGEVERSATAVSPRAAKPSDALTLLFLYERQLRRSYSVRPPTVTTDRAEMADCRFRRVYFKLQCSHWDCGHGASSWAGGTPVRADIVVGEEVAGFGSAACWSLRHKLQPGSSTDCGSPVLAPTRSGAV